jgi:hypothetical protein
MKYYIWFLPITICLIGASVLMWYQKEGWGWLLFVALCLIPSKSNEKDSETI